MHERGATTFLFVVLGLIFVYSVMSIESGWTGAQVTDRGRESAGGRSDEVRAGETSLGLDDRPERVWIVSSREEDKIDTSLSVLPEKLSLLPRAPLVTKRVFISSASFTGGFGYVGAVGYCQQTATKAGLGGRWVPWLSFKDGTGYSVQVKDKITSARYVLLDGTVVAKDMQALLSGKLDAPITLTERLESLPLGTYVWTGTTSSGAGTGVDCGEWTSSSSGQLGTVGLVGFVSHKWTDALGYPCGTKEPHLYCFEL